MSAETVRASHHHADAFSPQRLLGALSAETQGDREKIWLTLDGRNGCSAPCLPRPQGFDVRPSMALVAATAARSLDNRDTLEHAEAFAAWLPQRLLGASTTETDTRHGYRIVYCLAAKDARCLFCRDKNGYVRVADGSIVAKAARCLDNRDGGVLQQDDRVLKPQRLLGASSAETSFWGD